MNKTSGKILNNEQLDLPYNELLATQNNPSNNYQASRQGRSRNFSGGASATLNEVRTTDHHQALIMRTIGSDAPSKHSLSSISNSNASQIRENMSNLSISSKNKNRSRIKYATQNAKYKKTKLAEKMKAYSGTRAQKVMLDVGNQYVNQVENVYGR